MRIIFCLVFYNPHDQIPLSIILKSFYIGLKFDIRLVFLIHLPFLLGLFKPSLFSKKIIKKFFVIYFPLTLAACLLIYLIDFGNFSYLETRLEAATMRYLLNLSTSLQMVWQTYPVIPALACLIIFYFITYKVYKKLAQILLKEELKIKSKGKELVTIAMIIIIIATGIYGKFSHYPLRWSDAFFSPYHFASYLALNPVLYFVITFQHKEETYNEDMVRQYYPLMVDFLSIKEPDMEKLNFVRFERPVNPVANRPNIVVIILESLAAHKTGIFGNPLNPTPHLDSLANESILFTNFYVQSQGTARSVWTFITGLPDIEIQSTSTRNPRVVKQHTIINSFEGYEKYYFLGGSANWANIRGLISSNIHDIKIYEEGDYRSPRVDVWGISDLHLFEEANNVLKSAKEPFFAIIQTSGSHRPYTIPKDNRGFKNISIDDTTAKNYGFVSEKEFNAFRFLDHSLGYYIELSKKEKYFRNTIFILFGDHGLPSRAPFMRKSEELLGLNRIHVPLIIYAPSFIKKHKAIDILANEMDLLPTIASLAGISYINSTLGRNLFDPSFAHRRVSFHILDHGTNPILGLIEKEFYFSMTKDGTQKGLYKLDSENPRENLINIYPDIASSMEDLCRAIYETARYMRFNNKITAIQNKLKKG
jgi:phosphoglycerol transferase MdoB-like AlkP superfamily enzyme